MAFQSVPETAEVVIRASHASKEIVNVLHARRSGGYNSTQLQDLVDAVGGAVDTAYNAVCNGNVVFNGCSSKGLELINDIEAFSSDPTGSGTQGTDPLPANVSFVTTLRSGLTGRSARGRIYAFPPGSDALDTTPNLFTSTYANAVIAMWVSVHGAIALAGWQMVIVSRFTNLALRPTGVTFPVTDLEARNRLVDSSRGRLAKGH